MRFDWRVSAGAAGAALFLSLVTGLISGVPFVTLLVRALIGAALFAVGGAAISYAVDTYLPGLKSTGTATAREDSGSGENGKMVDIVVDDPVDDEDAPQELELDELDEADDADDDVEEFETGEPESADEVLEAEEVAEFETAGGETGEAEDVETADEAGELEEAPDAELPGRLPDIEGLSDSFSDGHAEIEDGVDSGRSGEDPSMMARAIRTVLKREE